MKILLINSVCGIGSTGRICADLAKKFDAEGHEVKIAYGRSQHIPKQYYKYAIKIGNNFSVKMHALRTRLLDEHGFGSKNATKKFLEWAEDYNPDIVWLHNIHGYYINIELLFKWIKNRPNMQVKWTLHDCWAFTGHCAYFTMAKCDKWKKKCMKCEQVDKYPSSFWRDNSENNFLRKRMAFTGVKNMSLITPSKWLADLVKESYLKEYPVDVVYNTIDYNIFKSTESSLREKWGICDNKVLLGVASVWDERKGLMDFYKLAEMLDKEYVLILVGLTRKQISQLPKHVKGVEQIETADTSIAIFVNDMHSSYFKEKIKEKQKDLDKPRYARSVNFDSTGFAIPQGVTYLYQEILNIFSDEKRIMPYEGIGKIICVPKTNSPNDLAAIYTSADVFLNPTYEDNYPTVNLEALACGTKVITYDTGGSKETLQSKNYKHNNISK